MFKTLSISMEDKEILLHELNKIEFDEADYLKTIWIDATEEEKKNFIRDWLSWLSEWVSAQNPKELAKTNKVFNVSLEDILSIQAIKEISDIHLSRWELPIMKTNWEEIRIWLEFSDDPDFESQFWRTKLDFNQVKKLCFDFMNLKEKEKLLTDWVVEKNYKMMVNWKLTTFRFSIYINNWAISLVSRFINPKIWDLEYLIENWLPSIIKKTLLNQSSWLVLVAWPMASWKSFTLASILEYINLTQKKHIVTIEDPIEVIFTPKLCTFSQREVWKDTTDFYKWAKNSLRQDAQIKLMWEIRTPEAMEAAIDAATNWMLVFATTHSASVEDCIRYFYDSVSKERKQTIIQALTSVLRWILVQRMITRLTYEEVEEENEFWEKEIYEKAKTERVIVYELLVNNMRLMQWLKPNENWQIDFRKIKNNIQDEWKAYWNISLNDSLIWLLLAKRITLKEAFAVTYDKLWLKDMIRDTEWLRFKEIEIEQAI